MPFGNGREGGEVDLGKEGVAGEGQVFLEWEGKTLNLSRTLAETSQNLYTMSSLKISAHLSKSPQVSSSNHFNTPEKVSFKSPSQPPDLDPYPPQCPKYIAKSMF